MDTYFMINGNKYSYEELSPILDTYFLKSLDYVISYYYGKKLTNDLQFWMNIPKEEREWISIDELKTSFLINKKLIGINLDDKSPIIADGQYWIYKIEELMGYYNDLNSPNEGNNIYLFDNKMELIICYLYESNSILVWGKLKKNLFRNK